jgi:hypothetical protein
MLLPRVYKLVFWALAWCFCTIFIQAIIKFCISYYTSPVATFTTKPAAIATTAATITTFTVDGTPVIDSEAKLSRKSWSSKRGTGLEWWRYVLRGCVRRGGWSLPDVFHAVIKASRMLCPLV